MSKKCGPWVVWGLAYRPQNLLDSDMVEVVCFDSITGEIESNLDTRSALSHCWKKGNTLAYRVVIEQIETVIYGNVKLNSWNKLKTDSDTHKVIMTTLKDGTVVSYLVEKL